MKKFILAFGMILSEYSDLQAHSNLNNLTGFYFGLHGGKELTKLKRKYHEDASLSGILFGRPAVLATLKANDERSSNLQGLLGGVHLGYQYDFNRLIAGIEGSLTKHRCHKKIHARKDYHVVSPNPLKVSTDINLKVQQKSSYGLDLRLGYKVVPQWVAGIKLGYAINNIHVNTNIVTFDEGDGNTVRHAVSKKMTSRSFIPGVYVDKFINSHLMIGAEYSYSITKTKSLKKKFTGKYHDGSTDRTQNINLSLKSRTQSFKLRLGYKF